MNKKIPKILAIIPCYNEAESIGKLLQEFSTLDTPIDTLVIDDGSQDQTYSIAKQFSKCIRLEKNQGVPTAIRLGIRYALENNYDFCIQIDGDGQHVPSEISKFINSLETSSPNILIGSRYCQQSFIFSRWGVRRIAGLMISFQLFLFWRKWIFDPLSGMRMMDKIAMRYFSEHIDHCSLDAQILPFALNPGLTVVEVPVEMRLREHGRSYVSGLKGMKFMACLVYQICLLKFHK